MTQSIHETPKVVTNSSLLRLRSLSKNLFATTRRCHAIGCITCGTLIGATVWVWANPDVMMTNSEGRRAELVDAVQLLEEADMWRQKYVSYSEEHESLKLRKLAIARWLPMAVDGAKVEAGFRSAAAETNVEVVSLRQLDKHVGARVGIVECECQIKGSYQSICALIQRLSSQDMRTSSDTQSPGSIDKTGMYPVWCHQVRFQRLPVLVENQIQCAATLMIRVPYAAEGSAAAKILEQGKNDASSH